MTKFNINQSNISMIENIDVLKNAEFLNFKDCFLKNTCFLKDLVNLKTIRFNRVHLSHLTHLPMSGELRFSNSVVGISNSIGVEEVLSRISSFCSKTIALGDVDRRVTDHMEKSFQRRSLLEINRQFDQSSETKALFDSPRQLHVWNTATRVYSMCEVSYFELEDEFAAGNNDPKEIYQRYKDKDPERLKGITTKNFNQRPVKREVYIQTMKATDLQAKIRATSLSEASKDVLATYAERLEGASVSFYTDLFIDKVSTQMGSTFSPFLRTLMSLCAYAESPNKAKVMVKFAYFGSEGDQAPIDDPEAWYLLYFDGHLQERQRSCLSIGHDQYRNTLLLSTNATETHCPVYLAGEESFVTDPTRTALYNRIFHSIFDMFQAISHMRIHGEFVEL